MEVSEETAAMFMSVTGSTLEEAKQYLEMSAHDIDRAVELWTSLGGGQGGSSAATTTSGAAGGGQRPEDPLDRDGVRAPIEIKQDTLYGTDYDDDRSNRASARRRTLEEQEEAAAAFTNFESTSGSNGIARRSSRNSRGAGKGAENGDSKLSSLFEPPKDLLFQGGDVDAAREAAMAQQKWLLINIQSHSEFASHLLNRDLWSHDIVKESVKACFIFAQYYQGSDTGDKVLMWYKVQKLPCILVIDPLTGTKMFAKEGQFVEPQTLLDDLMPFIDATPETYAKPKPKQGAEGPSNKGQGAGGAADAMAEDEQPEAMEEEEEEEEEMAEPMEEEPPKGQEGAVTIAVKLPTGDRAKRRFLADQKMRQVALFCKSLVPPPDAKRKFKLVCSATQTTFTQETIAQVTLREAGIVSNSMLMMVWV